MGSELLTELGSDDVEAVCAAIARFADGLRRGDLAASVVETVSEKLVALADDRNQDRTVRVAVADAARYVPDAFFERIIPKLTHDRNAWVAAAAERSLKARSTRRRENRTLDDQAAGIRKLERQVEAKFGKEALRLARQLGDAKSEFFAQRLSHEFKKVATTLQIVLSNLRSEAMRENLSRETIRERCQTALNHLGVMFSIVKSAVDEKGNAPTAFKTEAMAAILEHVVGLMREEASGKERLAIEVEVRPPDLSVEVDRGKIVQALLNVLHNAREAHPANGTGPIDVRVEARLAKGGAAVVISVEDHGCGIRAEDQPHLFTPFGSSKPGVRGLGLLNVKKMIEVAHGGEVELKSRVGVGTTVTFTLPRKQTPS